MAENPRALRENRKLIFSGMKKNTQHCFCPLADVRGAARPGKLYWSPWRLSCQKEGCSPGCSGQYSKAKMKNKHKIFTPIWQKPSSGEFLQVRCTTGNGRWGSAIAPKVRTSLSLNTRSSYANTYIFRAMKTSTLKAQLQCCAAHCDFYWDIIFIRWREW